MMLSLHGAAGVRLSFLLRRIALQKFTVANCEEFAGVRTTETAVFLTKRFTHQEKQQRDRRKIYEKRLDKILKKKSFPVIAIPPVITVGELARITDKTPEQVYSMKSVVENVKLKKKCRHFLDVEISGTLLSQLVKRLGFRSKVIEERTLNFREDKDIYAHPLTDDPAKLRPRPPIVAVMGHVDHGKTTILDVLRRTSVTASEAGGITQSIGAFSVPLTVNQTVTFLDTPGHSVFTSMRERGAKATDIVVLVVAADDGVMEQTIESIKVAKMVEATIVVALNKCDKQNADPNFTIEDLDFHGIKCEEIGGSVPAIRISALHNTGLDKLVESIVAQAERMDLMYDPGMQVQGFVLESQVERGRGNTASVIVKQGTLEVGKVLVAGTSTAKVRLMLDSNGKTLKFVRAGEAANIMGWRSLPMAGQIVLEADSEAKANVAAAQRQKELNFLKSEEIREVVEKKRNLEREEYEQLYKRSRSKRHRITESFRLAFKKNKIDDSVPQLNILVKADVDGSMEAIMKIFDSYDCEGDCHLNIVSSGIGDLKVSEYDLAEKLGATIFLYNTEIGAETKKKMKDTVDVCHHKVIYHFVNELKEKLTAKLPPADKIIIKGEAEVLQIFKKGRRQLIAGCKVKSGVLDSEDMFAVFRNDVTIHEGTVSSMRQHATAVSKITAGEECGIIFSETPDNSILLNDKIQCYTVVKEKRFIKWRPPGFL